MKNGITPGTIARTICLVLALFNQAMVMIGKPILPIDDATINETVAFIFTIVTSVIAWWKNNSFTKAALSADMVMRDLRNKEIGSDLDGE